MYELTTGISRRKPSMVRDGQPVRVRGTAELAEECKDLAHAAQECFVEITLNARNEIIDKHVVTVGLLNESLVHSREIFVRAITDNAAAVILVHNHPSGDPSPSAEDLCITKRLVDAGDILEIKVLDHMVVAPDDVNGGVKACSMREEGLIKFAA